MERITQIAMHLMKHRGEDLTILFLAFLLLRSRHRYNRIIRDLRLIKKELLIHDEDDD